MCNTICTFMVTLQFFSFLSLSVSVFCSSCTLDLFLTNKTKESHKEREGGVKYDREKGFNLFSM